MILHRILFAATLASSSSAFAGETPLYAPAPAWVERAALAPAATRDKTRVLLILDQQQRVEGGRVTLYSDVALQVTDAAMLSSAGTLSVPWVPEQGDVIVHRVEIVRGDQVIDQLAGARKFTVLRREAGLEQMRIDGMYTATLQVEDLRVGDVLRLAASVLREDAMLGGQVQSFAPLIPAEARPAFARVRASWPRDRRIAWRMLATGPAPKETVVDGWTRLDVAVPLPKQPDLPADVPARFRKPGLLEFSSFADWAAVSAVMAPLYDPKGTITDGSPLAKEVDAIAARERDPRRRAAAALRVVQDEVRYLLNGMNGGYYVPQKPAETWRLRYGDCKAKTLLLLAMLDRLGIPAEAMIVSAVTGDLVSERLPSPGAFDHVVVRADVGGKALWLDGTVIGTREADLGDVPAFRYALPVRASGAELVALQPSAPARATATSLMEVDNSAGIGLPTPYRITLTMTGPAAGMFNAAAAQASGEQREQLIDGVLSRFADTSLVEDRKVAYDAASGVATVTARGLANNAWQWSDAGWETQLDQTSSSLEFKPDRTRSAWRAMPVTTGNPETIDQQLVLRLPGDVAAYKLRGATSWAEPVAGVRVARTVAQADGAVRVSERTERSGREIEVAAIAAERAKAARFAAQPVKVRAPADTAARWQLAQGGGRARRFTEIVGFYDRAVAREPDEARHYRNRASFMAGIWDRKAALADWNKVVELEADASAYLARGAIHNANGDLPKAIADTEKALELDAGSIDTIATLADLRSRAGDHDAALALIDEHLDAAGEQRVSLLEQKATVLARAGQVDEAIALSDQAVADANNSADSLNGRCWLKGTHNVMLDTALADCTRGIQGADNLAAVLDSRALIHVRGARWTEAKADLDAALRLSPSTAGSLYLRGIVNARLGDKAAAGRDLAAARLIAPSVDREYSAWGIKP